MSRAGVRLFYRVQNLFQEGRRRAVRSPLTLCLSAQGSRWTDPMIAPAPIEHRDYAVSKKIRDIEK
jgi:hypothetical protein